MAEKKQKRKVHTGAHQPRIDTRRKRSNKGSDTKLIEPTKMVPLGVFMNRRQTAVLNGDVGPVDETPQKSAHELAAELRRANVEKLLVGYKNGEFSKLFKVGGTQPDKERRKQMGDMARIAFHIYLATMRDLTYAQVKRRGATSFGQAAEQDACMAAYEKYKDAYNERSAREGVRIARTMLAAMRDADKVDANN